MLGTLEEEEEVWRLLVEKAEMADLVITGSKPPTFTSKFEKHILE